MADESAAISIALKFADQATAPMKTALGDVQSSLQGLESAMGAAKVAAMAFLGVWTGKEILGIGSNYQKAVIQMGYTWTENADQMIAKAKELSDKSGKYFSFPEIAQAMVKSKDFMTELGLTTEEYLAGMQTAMGVAAIKGMDLESAMRLMERAGIGNKRAMTELGVVVTDDFMKVSAFGGQLKDLWGRLDEGSKFLLRYMAMMQQMGKYQNASGDMTKTFDGALKAMGNTLRAELGPDLAEASAQIAKNIGSMVPVIRDLAGALVGMVSLFNSLPDEVKGPLGMGILGTMLFGPKIGILIGIMDDFVKRFRSIQSEINSGELTMAGGTKMKVPKPDEGIVPVAEVPGKTRWGAIPAAPPSLGIPISQDQLAYQIAEAIKKIESGGDYAKHGASGEYGAYQFMPNTWKDFSSQYAEQMGMGSGPLQPTKEFQDAVAIWAIKQGLEKGYGPQQIASIWNSGSPEWKGKVGTNAQGVHYDVPAYVDKFNAAFSGVQQLPMDRLKLTPGLSATDIDQYVRQIEAKQSELALKSKETTDAVFSAQLTRQGDFLSAGQVEIQSWAAKQADSVWKIISDAQGRFTELTQHIAKKGLDPSGTEEYQKALALLNVTWSEGLTIIQRTLPELEREKQIQNELKNLARVTELAQVNEQYVKLTGNMQQQYEAQVLVLEAERQQKVLAAGGDITKLGQAYNVLFNEQKRLADLHAHGSFFEGLNEGARQFMTTLPTAADYGIQAFGLLRNSINSSADALAEMCVTGKTNFSGLLQSMERDLLKFAFTAAENQLFGMLFSFLGFGGSAATPMTPMVQNPWPVWGGGKASGGAVGPGLYLVGERGPELLNLDRSGTIIPNGQIGGYGGGGTPVVLQSIVHYHAAPAGPGQTQPDAKEHKKMLNLIHKANEAQMMELVNREKRQFGALSKKVEI